MRRKKVMVAVVQLAMCASVLAQVENDSVMRTYDLDEVTVTSSHFGNEHSLNKSSLLADDLQQQNMGENLPYLLQKTPSLVVTSDDGLGIGYTYFRVRGTDQSRINMTINGIPLNDSESQTVFWVNMTDMVGSMSKVDVQRGVGTSMNGAAAFGASVNMQTELVHQNPYAEMSFNGGSYNTFRESVKVGTGLLKHGFSLDARYSKVDSKGYVEHGTSDLHSYFVAGSWYGTNTMVKLLAFGGKEKSGIAWDGISPTMWRDNPRYNGAGEYVDGNGDIQYYDNNTDNYLQQHYQALVSHIFNRKWSLNAALHYTHGDGYTEQVKYAKLKEYALPTYMDAGGNEVKKSNLVRRKHLVNDFYGGTIAAHYAAKSVKVSFGAAANYYNGIHYGRVLQMLDENYPNAVENHEYYRNRGDKVDANAFAKANWEIIKGLSVFGDLQYRFIDYRLKGVNDEDLGEIDFKNQFHFFNPKAGISYLNNGHNVYATFSMANREPTRKNYTECGPNDEPKPETLYDYELGYSYSHRIFNVGANLYFMDYDNQLVLTGKLSDTGAALTRNVKDSYRMGIELLAGVQIAKCLRWDVNLTLSRNKILNYTDWVDDWYADWSDPEVVKNAGQVEMNYGTTDIAFSPNILVGSMVSFDMKGFSATFQTNFVGSQYLDNTMNKASKLPAYCVNNLGLAYCLPIKKVLKDITFRVQMNNLFNAKYVSNGWSYSYFEGADANGNFTRENQKYEVGYYAQAPFNIHAGFVVRF